MRYAGIKELKQIIYDNVFGSDNRNHINELIDSAPSIEIIRCSECRYWHSGECWGIPYRGDYDTSIDTKADDFCSYGEREGE